MQACKDAEACRADAQAAKRHAESLAVQKAHDDGNLAKMEAECAQLKQVSVLPGHKHAANRADDHIQGYAS